MSKEEGRDTLTVIGLLAVGTTMVLAVLFLSQTLLSTPNMLYPMVIALLLALVMGLVKASYPRPPVFRAGKYVDPLEQEDGSEEVNGEGDHYLAYVELKHLLIDRVMARRSLDKAGWDRAVGDDAALFRILEDEDLLRLVRLNDRAPKVPRGQRIEGVVLGDGFEKRFDYLLGKVEGWQ